MEPLWGMYAPHLHCCFSKAWQTAARQTPLLSLCTDMWQSGLLLGFTVYIHTCTETLRSPFVFSLIFVPMCCAILHPRWLFEYILISKTVCLRLYGLCYTSWRAPVKCCDIFLLTYWRIKCEFSASAPLVSSSVLLWRPLLLMLTTQFFSFCWFLTNKQKPITSCVPEDFDQESPTRHQVLRLANAKIHKLSISWIILFPNRHLFIWNVAHYSLISGCVISSCTISIFQHTHKVS